MIRERCSCGAKFATDEPDALKMVREWRKSHQCNTEEMPDTPTSGQAQVETQIGFTAHGISVPAKDYDPFEDKR